MKVISFSQSLTEYKPWAVEIVWVLESYRNEFRSYFYKLIPCPTWGQVLDPSEDQFFSAFDNLIILNSQEE